MFYNAIFYALSFAGGYFLWLGLYILTRGVPMSMAKLRSFDWWHDVTVSAGLSFVLASGYLFGTAMEFVSLEKATYLFWDRLTWWTIPLSVAFWFRSIILISDRDLVELERLSPSLNSPRVTRNQTPKLNSFALWFVLVYALSVAITGSLFEFFYRYSDIQFLETALGSFFVPPLFPQHHLYSFFLLVSLWTSTFLLYQQYKISTRNSSQKRQLVLLGTGNSLLALGATVSIIGYDNMQGLVPEYVGGLIMTIGLALIGQGIVKYNALIQQQVVAYDFKQSLYSTTIAVVFCLSLFHIVHWLSGHILTQVTIPLLIFLITFIFTSSSWLRWIIDSCLLPNWQARFLLRITKVGQKVMLATDQQAALGFAQKELAKITKGAQQGQIREMIQEEINVIFRHKTFHKDAVLANSRLFSLDIVQQAVTEFRQQNNIIDTLLSEGEKARVLRSFLASYIQMKLCPATEETPTEILSDRWIEYILLYQGYIEDRTRKEIIHGIYKKYGIRLAGSGSTGGRQYAHHLKNARTHLAHTLWYNEVRHHQHG